MVWTCMELGYVINLQRVNPEHLWDIITELRGVDNICSISKQVIFSLRGKLHFVWCVCHSGWIFLQWMINKSKKAYMLHHHTKHNEEFLCDVTWWLSYLPTWNGVRLLYNFQWLTSPSCQLFTNVSDFKSGCYFQGHWCWGSSIQFPYKTGLCPSTGVSSMLPPWLWLSEVPNSLPGKSFCTVTMQQLSTLWPAVHLATRPWWYWSDPSPCWPCSTT